MPADPRWYDWALLVLVALDVVILFCGFVVPLFVPSWGIDPREYPHL